MSAISTKQCACKWVLRHQHKLKQIARSCSSSLKVKEAYGQEERPLEYEIPETEYTFRATDLKITLAEPNQRREKPRNSELKFGHVFTDHMMKIFYHSKLGGWQKPVVIPFENITLHPAAKVLHYAIELFEGMKAYRGVDGRIRIFRPDLNMRRMNQSAMSAGLPTFEGRELINCIKKLVQVDQDWVPSNECNSLYIRPTLIGIDGTLGVQQSDSALLYTILCPVAGYFTGVQSISLYADPSYARAWPGGLGDKKVGSNYGPTIRVQKRASKHGRHQVLWLYGEDHQITEVGTMNVFVFYVDSNGEKVLVTPALNGLILPGITRQSIIELCHQWGEFRIEERNITMPEVLKYNDTGRLLEMFGSGTACIVAPFSSIEYMDRVINIPTEEHPRPIYKRILEQLYAIQFGHIAHPWAETID